MSISEQLISSSAVWEEFLAWRLKKRRFNWYDFESSDAFVASEKCIKVARRMVLQGEIGVPTKFLINKMGSGKKRVIYCYGKDEMEVLKLIAHLLYRYDDILANNCYSFRRSQSVRKAIFQLQKEISGRCLWGYKLDIHNYFNSIPITLLLPILKKILSDDKPLFIFFEKMLSNPFVRDGDNIVKEEHGIMAGVPTAPFLANLYLKDMDFFFEEKKILYARYSDDIILFAPDKKTLNQHKASLQSFLQQYQLKPNPNKERVYAPGQPFDFLGFKCSGSQIGLADSTINKMKSKIRRKARSISRWRSKNAKEPELAIKALIKYFNYKFFENDDSNCLTWSRWFYPVINEISGLRAIDHYLQQYLRFVATGRHNGANYRIQYQKLKSLGYRSLVSDYYNTLKKC